MRQPPDKQDIVRALASLGQTLGTLAYNAGEPLNTLYVAMHKSSSLRGEIIIAQFLEVDPRFLWPGRWETPTPAREVWLLENAEKLAQWGGKRLEDVERPRKPGAPPWLSWEIPQSCGLTAGKTAFSSLNLRAVLHGLVPPGPADRPRFFGGKTAR